MPARLACQHAGSSIFPQRFAQAARRSGDRIIFLVEFVARYFAVGYAREFDQKFPGFETDIHGLRFEPIPGGRRYLVDCIATGAE